MTVRSSNFSQIIVALILCTLFSVQIHARIDAEINFEVEGSGFHRLGLPHVLLSTKSKQYAIFVQLLISFFFRTLIYHVFFKNFINENCYAAIYMELPSVLYINVNDIAELRRQGMVCILNK